jgi:hypothetical protein
MNTASNSTAPLPLATDVLAALALALPWLAAALLPALAQPQSYHAFADQRTLLGVPHAMNVLSNIPFFLIGASGLTWLISKRIDRSVALPYGLFFAGTLLTALGSAWYHAAPSDVTLVWDRLPIAVSFAGLVAATLADRAPERAALYTIALAAVGVATVLTWAASGNLLPYFVMQGVFVAAALFATARMPSRYTHARWLYGAVALYAVALVCEQFDGPLHRWFAAALSGHTIKHLVAAAAVCVVFAMLVRRAPAQ